jgi:hypothetical protein
MVFYNETINDVFTKRIRYFLFIGIYDTIDTVLDKHINIPIIKIPNLFEISYIVKFIAVKIITIV